MNNTVTNSRAIWKGMLTFGLVTVPVAIYSAVREYKSPFHQFRKRDLSPIRYKKVAQIDEIQVSQEEIVQGVEVEKGKVVAFNDQELDAINIPSAKVLDIDCFVKESEIDSRLYSKPYFIQPEKGAMKGYSVLYEALKATGKAGVAKVAVRGREYLNVVTANAQFKMLVMQSIRFNDEVLIPQLTEAESCSKEEVKFAKMLIDQKTERFDHPKYKNNYRDALNELINMKLKGENIVLKGRPKLTEIKVPDILETLRNSVKVNVKKTDKKAAKKIAA